MSLGYKNFKVLISHAHFDHIGSISDFSPEEIIINQKILHNLQNPKCWALEYLQPKDFQNYDLYQKTKIKLKNTLNFIAQLTPYNSKKIKIGNANLEIIETPGHTDDSIIVNDKTNKIIITGDSLYFGQIYLNCVNSNVKKIKQTLQKIKKLDPDLILPGHNEIIIKNEVSLAIQTWIDKIE